MARLIEKDEISGIPREDFAEPKNFIGNFDQYLAAEDKLYARLQERHNVSIEKGKVSPGFMARFPRADGYALYIVENLKPLELQHVPLGDAYEIDAAHLRGLRIDDLQHQLDFALAWERATKKQSNS